MPEHTCRTCGGSGVLRDVPHLDKDGNEVACFDMPCADCGGTGYAQSRMEGSRATEGYGYLTPSEQDFYRSQNRKPGQID